jgi:hypothetical protein
MVQALHSNNVEQLWQCTDYAFQSQAKPSRGSIQIPGLEYLRLKLELDSSATGHSQAADHTPHLLQ